MKHIKLFEDRFEVDDELLRDRKEKIIRLKNPLNMKDRIGAKRWIYKISLPIISPPGHSIFRDDNWEPVTQLFKKWNQEGVDWDFYENPKYFNFPVTDDMNLPYKQWYIVIKWNNAKGRESELIGTLTAHFNGTQEDPLQKYDLTLVIS